MKKVYNILFYTLFTLFKFIFNQNPGELVILGIEPNAGPIYGTYD